jgi:hypothetical protein
MQMWVHPSLETARLRLVSARFFGHYLHTGTGPEAGFLGVLTAFLRVEKKDEWGRDESRPAALA